MLSVNDTDGLNLDRSSDLLARSLPFLQGTNTEDHLEDLIQEIMDFLDSQGFIR